MSVAVELADLADVIARFRFAYLLTVGDDGRSRVLAVQPQVADGRITVENLGRSSRRNAIARSTATLLWPPKDGKDHSLIVDGDAVVTGETLTLTPTHAVLHEPVSQRRAC